MTDCQEGGLFRTLILGTVGLVVLVALASWAWGHEGLSPEVDRFYSTWFSPRPYGAPENRRTASCCNHTDCKAVRVRFHEGKEQVWWEPWQKWVDVPADVIEQDQPDPRDSPDGQNHACIYEFPGGGSTYPPDFRCYTRGTGT